ncbi:hypothetical protein E0L36_12460 [Streptomyces sp. AJS327]|uniref:hypothetical protein n=1 Tax=Streptomyces sp. AJS327 TaxID=2545265 RepID=UPI0015DFFA26|nr:hypothetical protein [Streptomyces sp. AJS327]MBA0051679.1 hypothetical protein [Streptomyces sp. AJS327]
MWTGSGGLVPLLYALGAVLGAATGEPIAAFFGGCLAGVVLWRVGDREGEHEDWWANTFFFVPTRYWGLAGFVLCGAMVVTLALDPSYGA